jgi:hypothetical protein
MGTYINILVTGSFLAAITVTSILLFERRKKRDTFQTAGVGMSFSQPVINVIFDPDGKEDDVVVRSLADMFIGNRVYFYTGQPLPGREEHSQENKIIVLYKDIDFSEYKDIKV